MVDVIVIGGGVIGLSVAYELAEQGAGVQILDQGPLGREASWAGAGMLPPGNLAYSLSPEQRLRSLSSSLWSSLSENLKSATGIDNGYLQSGGLELRLEGTPGQLETEQTAWQNEGVFPAETSVADLRKLEPAISPKIVAGYRLPELAQVRNPRHLKALIAACAQRGVEFSPGTPAWGVDRHAEKIVGVKTPAGTFRAGPFCLCAGAWSARLAESVNFSVPIRPVRGQIVLLKTGSLPFRHVLMSGPRYLVPRPERPG